MKVRPVDRRDKTEWLRMRTSLWPSSHEVHESEIDELLSMAARTTFVVVAERENGSLCGFLEAGTRDYAEKCSSSPVGYIEGWWVDPDSRRTSIGASLVAAAETWARSLGLTEVASDSELTNELGQAAHRALGYQEVERIVCIRKQL